MKKRILSLALVVALVMVAVAGATMAYFTDTEQAVNVATVGNVSIKQHEQERAEDGTLQEFTQGKGLAPAYATDWTVTNGFWTNVSGALDKIVTVENDGASDTYFRTWIAYECPVGMTVGTTTDADIIISDNSSDYTVQYVTTTAIGDNTYAIYCYTYNEALASGATSEPSLVQFAMSPAATNAEAALIGETYEILVFTQAVQTDNFSSNTTALTEAFGNDIPWAADYELPTVVRTPEELVTALTAAGAAGSGNTEIMLIDDLDLTGYDWTPIEVDGYHGAGIITVYGNNNTITGLNAPLFAGGFAGKSGIEIFDLTIADSTIKSDSTLGAGAFIETADSMQVITLSNCHLVNSKVLAPEARTGGLLGWASGYSKQNDGPVKTYITIENCSVIDCELTGTSIGGIAGHPGASDWTWTTINNPIVLNTVMTSTDDGGWRVGDVVGTANNGHIVINNAITGNNTKTMPNSSDDISVAYDALVGRFVPAGTGTLEINGARYGVNTVPGLYKALEAGEDVVLVGDLDLDSEQSNAYGITGLNQKQGGIIDGNGNTLDVSGANGTWDSGINTTGGTIQNITVTGAFRGIFINHTSTHSERVILNNVVITPGAYTISCDQGMNQGLTATNCTFNGWTSYAKTLGDAEFINCHFDTNGTYKYMRPYAPTVLKGCTFCVGFGLDATRTTVTLENCYVGDTLITAENITSLLGSGAANAVVSNG